MNASLEPPVGTKLQEVMQRSHVAHGIPAIIACFDLIPGAEPLWVLSLWALLSNLQTQKPDSAVSPALVPGAVKERLIHGRGGGSFPQVCWKSDPHIPGTFLLSPLSTMRHGGFDLCKALVPITHLRPLEDEMYL